MSDHSDSCSHEDFTGVRAAQFVWEHSAVCTFTLCTITTTGKDSTDGSQLQLMRLKSRAVHCALLSQHSYWAFGIIFLSLHLNILILYFNEILQYDWPIEGGLFHLYTCKFYLYTC